MRVSPRNFKALGASLLFREGICKHNPELRLELSGQSCNRQPTSVFVMYRWATF